uniref:Thioredoxin domain-containing protein n=1 Tax=candidate division WWE3 bacterium TaxID=2053526 RepID=A0A7C4XGJ9_UNCKA
MDQEIQVATPQEKTKLMGRNKFFSDWFSIILVLLLIGASFFIGKLSTQVEMMKDGRNVVANGNAVPEEEGLGEVDKPDFEKDHIFGDKSAKFALIEYSDYECPFCKTFHPTAKKAVEEYSGQLMWVYRHFPLEQIHPEARPTALASECVAKLAGEEAFWKFSDEMFATTALTAKAREDAAVKLGVNLADFNSCLQDPTMDQRIEDGLNSGAKAGIRGTPGNILMNLETGEVQSLAGAVPLENIKTILEDMMNK